MSILETIYESYIAGELDIKPESTLIEARENLAMLETRLKISGEDAEDFEEEFFYLLDDIEKKCFFAGFVTAAKLNAEISGKK